MERIRSVALYFVAVASQTRTLIKKDLILLSRGWRVTAAILLTPLLFMVLLFGIQEASSKFNVVPDPSPVDATIFPTCRVGAENRCFALFYSPNTSEIATQAMRILADQNNLTLVPTLSGAPQNSIVGFRNWSDIWNFTLAHPNVTQGAVIFHGDSTHAHLNVSLWYNASCPYGSVGSALALSCPDVRPQLHVALGRAFSALVTQTADTASSDGLTITLGPYPFLSEVSNVVAEYGALFFYCGVSLFSVTLLYHLVHEKEHRLRQTMRLAGMKMLSYWLSVLLVYSLGISLLVSFLLLGAGEAFRFPFFRQTNFAVLVLVFFSFALAIAQLSVLLATLLRTTKAALAAGMLIFIIGFLFTLVTGMFGNIFPSDLYRRKPTARAMKWILSALPAFHFAKAVSDISARSFKTGPLIGSGYSWKDLFVKPVGNYGPEDPTIFAVYAQFVLSAAFTLLACYLDQVLPTGDTTPLPWYFLFSSRYWGLTKAAALRNLPFEPAVDDDDLRAEHEAATRSVNAQCRIVALTKRFDSHDRAAVSGVSLAIEEGQIFCLLGQNGAGKSTTINLLTGVLAPSSGEAFFYGKSIVGDPAAVRKTLGVCMQQDVLWDELTGVEHLQLFAELKRVPARKISQQVRQALEAVQLDGVQSQQVGTYSGGMRRRLSVAMATIGEPKVVFLDEPTTGMDPVSRRHIWSLLQRIKRDCVIFLTTHSMEEADVLSDKIGILSRGQLRCIGKPLYLKNKFGGGYHINLVAVDCTMVAAAKQLVSQLLPSASLLTETGEYLHYSLPIAEMKTVVPFFKQLEQRSETDASFCIREWGVAHTTLDEVFLRVNRSAEGDSPAGMRRVLSGSLPNFASGNSSPNDTPTPWKL